MGKFKLIPAFIVFISLLAPNIGLSQDREYIGPSSATDAAGPLFSGAVLAGDTLYLSGMLGLVNGEAPDDPAEEARLILNSMKETLEEAGMTMDDLVYVQIFLPDVTHYDVFNSVYRSFFTSEFPARTFASVGTLVLNARFEIQSIAVRQ